MWRASVAVALVAAALALLPACQLAPKPDLERLYAIGQPSRDQPPVVLIHGAFGARLSERDGGSEVWPGGLWRLLFGDFQRLALPIDAQTLAPAPSSLVASGITDRVAGRDFYRAIIDTLQRAGRYRPGRPGENASDGLPRYYVFVYDWRQDIVDSVAQLDALIEQIRADYRKPALKVDVVAHSMGGLLTRYYIRYGTVDVLNDNDFPLNFHGAARLRRVLLLGTPSLGSAVALQNMIAGAPLGLRRIPPEVLATMPGAYQLLSHPLNDWLLAGDGRPLQRDLFDVDIWRRFQWSVFDPVVRARLAAGFDDGAAAERHLQLLEHYLEKYLERARRFVWSLTVREAESPVSLIVFGGDCQLTPARLLVEEVDGESRLRLWPREIARPLPGIDYEHLMLEPGDGSVTKASLLGRTQLDPRIARHRYSYFPLAYTLLSCEHHSRLTGNLQFQDNLLHVLLSLEP